MVQTFRDSILNIDRADVIGLRQAFTMLVEADHYGLPAEVTNEMSPSDRYLVLLRLCDRLANDSAPMPIETCAALDMLPGETFADGAARAKVVAQAKEAEHG